MSNEPATTGEQQETTVKDSKPKKEKAAKPKKEKAAKPKKEKAAKPKKEKAAKPDGAGRAPVTKGDGTKGSRRSEATKMICDLILANQKAAKPLTDAEIFARVQAKHKLDDSKRVYVGWYRGQMRREGVKNVPDAYKTTKAG